MDNPESAEAGNSATQEAEFKAPTDTGEGGSAPAAKPTSWLADLDPEIAKHPGINKFKTKDDLAKSYLNLEKLVGKEKIPIPGKNAKPEEWDAVYERLGRPKTPADYKIPDDYAPEEMRSPEGQDAFKKQAHKLGLLPHQVEGLYKWWVDQQVAGVNNQAEAYKGQVEESEKTLRKEWGYAYETNIAAVKKVLNQFGSPEDVQAVVNDPMVANNPSLLRILRAAGKRMSEDGIIGKGEGSFLSPEDAKAEIDKIKANPAYLNGDHPEHKQLVKKMQTLYQMAYGGQG